MVRFRTTGTKPGWRALPLGRLLGVCAMALMTANCAKNPQQLAGSSGSGGGIDPKYGVRASPRLYNEGDVIPKGGGRRFSGKPYTVAGRTYVPREDGRGYAREGLASWYGSAFHGRMTANGEVFDRHSIAAAHPTLPLPSYARVTNLANGRSMIVRVNDRGPYHADRVMDVSEQVAEMLEFHRRGTSRVRVEYVGKASVAGSDDRKLMATLRTDGRPAAGQGTIMLADLGGSDDAGSERFAKPSRPALASRPPADEDASEAPARPRPAAPIVLASAASVAVPAALQPGAARASAPFRPVAASRPEPAHSATAMRVAGTNPGKPGPASAQGRVSRLAEAAPSRAPVAGSAKGAAARIAQATPAGKPAATKDGAKAMAPAHLAGAPATKLAGAKGPMARLAAATPVKDAPVKAGSAKAASAKVASVKVASARESAAKDSSAKPAASKAAPVKSAASKSATATGKPSAPAHRSRLAGVY